MNNLEIVNHMIATAIEDGAPSDIIEAFRVEALESGYELASKRGTDWAANRSTLAQWYAARFEASRPVKFWWSFEDCGEEGLIRSVDVSGIEIEGLQDYAQDCGLAAARALVKRLAKKAGRPFVETTDEGLARDYARERMINWNQYQR